MSTYTGATPLSAVIDPRIVPFFESFYALSDDSTALERYAGYFMHDAQLEMGLKSAHGFQEILDLRKAMWAGPVNKRLHTLHKIFPYENHSHELMLYGSVQYGLKNGKSVTVEWAARAVLVDHHGELKFQFYQVYLDGAPVAAAAAAQD